MKAGLLLSLSILLMLIILKAIYFVDAHRTSATKDWVNFPHLHVCAVTGSSVVIPCSLTPPAGVTRVVKVFWVIYPKNGTEPPDLIANASYQERVKYFWDKNNIKNNCTLKLTDVRRTDRTEYKVRIVAQENKWLSHSGVKLSVTNDLSVSFCKPVVEGSELKLTCEHNCKSNPEVIWRKNGTDLPSKQSVNSKLLLPRVSTEDEGDYSCALKGHEGHPSKPVRLNVMFSPKKTSVSIRPNMINKGTAVTLTCSSDANPSVENYTWFKGNKSYPVGSGPQYNITNISSEDGGQYYCEAKNEYGAENSTAVSITVTAARSPVLYVISGVSVCGAAGLLCVLVWIRYQKRNSKTSRQENQNAKYSSAEATEGAQDNVQYAIVQPKHTRESARAQEDDIQYASVQFQQAGNAQGSSDQPDGELSVIYSCVETRT